MESTAGTPATFQAALQQIEHLRRALQTRDQIACAQGIVMERFGIDADSAMSALRRISMDQQLKVHALAAAVITGDSEFLLSLSSAEVPMPRPPAVRAVPTPPRRALSS